jgi:hypothetical protein
VIAARREVRNSWISFLVSTTTSLDLGTGGWETLPLPPSTGTPTRAGFALG